MMKTTFKRTVLSLLLASSTLAPLAAAHAAEGDVPFKAAVKAAADPALHDSLPEAIKKAGYIVAGTNPNTPPTTFYQADNKTLAGREIDVMSAIADRLGVAIHWKDTGGFDNIIPGLKSGRYDVALANIDANKKRFQQVDFVGYYNASKLALIARKDAALGLTPSWLRCAARPSAPAQAPRRSPACSRPAINASPPASRPSPCRSSRTARPGCRR